MTIVVVVNVELTTEGGTITVNYDLVDTPESLMFYIKVVVSAVKA